MILAIILLIGLPQAAQVQPASPQQSTAQSPPSSASQDSTQKDQAGQEQKPPASASPQSAAPQKPAKRTRHKKKPTSANCTTPQETKPGDTAGTAATNCPPIKIIVPQGGISDTSIQLAGGASGDQATHERDTANQMLESTQHNLNQLAGRQLDDGQKKMLTQTHQFMEQARKAVGDGELDRARTLAWKAQLLSEELIKPPQ